MSLPNSRVQSLKEMLALEEKRTALQGQLDAIEQRMSALKSSIFSGSPVKVSLAAIASPTGRKPGRPTGSKRASRGTHREVIMAALAAAGAAGVRVKDLAAAMKTKAVNIHSWFHSNLKRTPSIQKVTGGHYRLAAGASVPAPAPKAAPVAKVGKRGQGGKRGALSASILDQLKAAGAGGIKVADLADKLGAKYKNVYIWFATTGKKHGIKRIAPATYRLA